MIQSVIEAIIVPTIMAAAQVAMIATVVLVSPVDLHTLVGGPLAIAGNLVLPRGQRMASPSQASANEGDRSQSLGRGNNRRKHDDSPLWAIQANCHEQPILIAGSDNTASK
jgi:hypothetical protein